MTTSDLYCSFCHKGDRDVDTLVTAPACAICNECVDLCVDIVEHHKAMRKHGPRDMVAEDLGMRSRLEIVSASVEEARKDAASFTAMIEKALFG